MTTWLSAPACFSQKKPFPKKTVWPNINGDLIYLFFGLSPTSHFIVRKKTFKRPILKFVPVEKIHWNVWSDFFFSNSNQTFPVSGKTQRLLKISALGVERYLRTIITNPGHAESQLTYRIFFQRSGCTPMLQALIELLLTKGRPLSFKPPDTLVFELWLFPALHRHAKTHQRTDICSEFSGSAVKRWTRGVTYLL